MVTPGISLLNKLVRHRFNKEALQELTVAERDELGEILVEKGVEAEQQGDKDMIQAVDRAEQKLQRFEASLQSAEPGAQPGHPDSTTAQPRQQRQEGDGYEVTIGGEMYTVRSQEEVAEVYAEQAREQGYTVVTVEPDRLVIESGEGEEEIPVPPVPEVQTNAG